MRHHSRPVVLLAAALGLSCAGDPPTGTGLEPESDTPPVAPVRSATGAEIGTLRVALEDVVDRLLPALEGPTADRLRPAVRGLADALDGGDRVVALRSVAGLERALGHRHQRQDRPERGGEDLDVIRMVAGHARDMLLDAGPPQRVGPR